MADETTTTTARARAKPGAVLAVACAGVVLSSLDLFIVNVALPQIARSFGHADLSSLSWVLNGYAIVFAALLIPAGRLADRTSRRGGFLLGVAIFTVASALCAISTSVDLLVAFRVVQAVGAALLVPTSLGLVMTAYSVERRGGAVRIWAAMGGFAAAIGPVVGGLLVSANWRWVFLVNVPIGIAAFVGGRAVFPKTPGEGGPLPDLVGTALLTLGIGTLTLALVDANSWGWGSAKEILSLVVAGVSLAVFLVRSAHHPSPVLELALLADPSYALTTGAAVLFSAAFGGMLLTIVLWAQDDWGWSALQTGLAVAPGPLMVPLFSVVAGRLIRRIGPGGTIAAGCTVFAAGILWWHSAIGLEPDYVGGMLGGMLLTGVGVGLTMPTLFSTASASLPPSRFATGSAVISMARQLGLIIGVALFVAVLGAPASPAGTLDGFDRGWVLIAVLALAGGVAALLLYRYRPTAPAIALVPVAEHGTPADGDLSSGS